MIAYVDSSILLRVMLNQKNSLAEFAKIKKPVASILLHTECLRTLDRLKLLNQLSEDDYVKVVKDFYDATASFEYVRLTSGVLNRASAPMPVALGTLDAIHLSSALLWAERFDVTPVFLTHDQQLARAATASGLDVLGVGG